MYKDKIIRGARRKNPSPVPIKSRTYLSRQSPNRGQRIQRSLDILRIEIKSITNEASYFLNELERLAITLRQNELRHDITKANTRLHTYFNLDTPLPATVDEIDEAMAALQNIFSLTRMFLGAAKITQTNSAADHETEKTNQQQRGE